jgi:hypothetical protein
LDRPLQPHRHLLTPAAFTVRRDKTLAAIEQRGKRLKAIAAVRVKPNRCSCSRRPTAAASGATGVSRAGRTRTSSQRGLHFWFRVHCDWGKERKEKHGRRKLETAATSRCWVCMRVDNKQTQ